MFCRIEESRSITCRSLAVAAIGAFLIGSIGCGDSGSREGGANTPKAKENRKVAENTALEGVQFAAREQVAHHEELKKKGMGEKLVSAMFPSVSVTANSAPSAPPAPTPPVAPKPPMVQQPQAPAFKSVEPLARSEARRTSVVVISERIVTEIPYPTEAEADTRALEEAQKLIEKRLKELDPPVDYFPPVSVVKNEYVRKDSRLVRLPSESEKNAIALAGYAEGRRYVEYTVEITGEQVRELRTRNRVTDGLRALGAIAAVSLAGFFFLRLDEWSKGYLTSWLALAAAALGGGIVAAVVFV